MDTERSGLDEAMDVGSSTVSHLKSLKTAATFSKAGYGAALGGPFTAAIGAVIANRNQLAKILLVILAILLLPVLFIVMLPGLIFGSLTEQSDVLNSNSMISENIRASREAIVEVLEESHEDILAEIHAAISRLPQGDTASINDPYTYSISVNANLLISQFCASQDDYKNINLNQLKKLIRENKEGLFSYDVATETVTMEVTVDGGAEGEAGTEQGQAQTQTVTFTKHTYTVVYAGDSYFADHVFHLTDKQKELAKNYAENLTAFFGTASSGIVAAINLSDEVLSYRPAVERAAAKYGMSDYVDLILAVMMQESGGRGLDVMQAAEGGFNTRYPHVPNGITDPEYSIECGIQELKYALDKAGCTGPTDLDRIKLALQGYNYGSAYIDWAMERDGGYTKENAIAYSDMMCARPSWPYDRYGDKEYVEHVLRYYQITASGGSYPANGMQIPHYLQTDYGNIPYGGGSIASSGCGPTSFAMIASYLTGTTITPIDAISWCGNSYYKPGVGTYWSYFQAASDHFGCGTVTQTSDPNQVLQALSEGHPVISSQRAGLFTSGGHFIVLRGVTAGGKVLVNDPNDSSSKNYINREFDMMTEVHATANAYWIFAKKIKETLMNRKKVILAIFMMAFLIIIGFVFPSIWKSQKGNKKSETENTQHDNNENTETEQAENNESISFQDFEALEYFFSKEQVKLFQEELTSYLKNVKQMSLTSIRFLADDTTYPNASDINFLFQLPDKSVLPVYYTSPTGRFFFGEERTPDSGKEIIYERPTDDKLPSITTEEIEQLQEGGYDDTSVNSEKAAPVTEVPETPSMEEPKEVQP